MRLAASGVQLRAGASELARSLPASGRFAGERLAPQGVQLAMQSAGAVIAVSDEDVRAINDRHSSQQLAAEDLVVFQDFALSDARIVSPPIRFTRAALDTLAEQAAAGRTVCHQHRHTEVIGTTFAADVVEQEVRGVSAHWLRLRWYAVLTDQTSPERRQRVQDCRTGALRYGSVGVTGGEWDFVEMEGPDGPEFFYLVDTSDTLSLMEYSRCHLGAASGAGDHKFSAGTPAPIAPPAPPVRTSPDLVCVL